MVQGTVKKAKPAASKKAKPVYTKGTRVIKPKKAALVKQNQMKKKHSAGLTAVTEAALAQKAGHLEMLKGGKKDAKGSNARHKN